MDSALRAAATGMQAQQTRVEVIANNLANVNTTGFKGTGEIAPGEKKSTNPPRWA